MFNSFSSFGFFLSESTRYDLFSWGHLVLSGVLSAAALGLSFLRRTAVGVRVATSLWGAALACLAWGAAIARLEEVNGLYNVDVGHIPRADATVYLASLEEYVLDWRWKGVAAGLLLAISGWVVMLRREKASAPVKRSGRRGWGIAALGGTLALLFLSMGKISAWHEQIRGEEISSHMALAERPSMIAICEVRAQYAETVGSLFAAWSLALTLALSGALFARRRDEWTIHGPLPAAELPSALGQS